MRILFVYLSCAAVILENQGTPVSECTHLDVRGASDYTIDGLYHPVKALEGAKTCSTGHTRYRQVTTYLDAYRQRLSTILFYNQDVQRYVFGVWECQGEPLATSNNTQVTSPTAVSQWLEFTGERQDNNDIVVRASSIQVTCQANTSLEYHILQDWLHRAEADECNYMGLHGAIVHARYIGIFERVNASLAQLYPDCSARPMYKHLGTYSPKYLFYSSHHGYWIVSHTPCVQYAYMAANSRVYHPSHIPRLWSEYDLSDRRFTNLGLHFSCIKQVCEVLQIKDSYPKISGLFDRIPHDCTRGFPGWKRRDMTFDLDNVYLHHVPRVLTDEDPEGRWMVCDFDSCITQAGHCWAKTDKEHLLPYGSQVTYLDYVDVYAPKNETQYTWAATDRVHVSCVRTMEETTVPEETTQDTKPYTTQRFKYTTSRHRPPTTQQTNGAECNLCTCDRALITCALLTISHMVIIIQQDKYYTDD